MKARELILLSPYNYPAQNPLTLSDEEMAAWLNAYTALWHPAVLWGAAEPPRIDLPYDYEEPQGHHVYAVPDEPPMVMPDDWQERVKNIGAITFEALAGRDETLTAALAAYAEMPPHPFQPFADSADEAAPPDDQQSELPPDEPNNLNDYKDQNSEEPTPSAEEIHQRLLQLPPEQVRPFFALGLGYLFLAALSEGMEHENLLEMQDFWQDVQHGIAALVDLPAPAPPDFSGYGEPSGYAGDYEPRYDDDPYEENSPDYVPPDIDQPENLPEDDRYNDLPGAAEGDSAGDYPEEKYDEEYYNAGDRPPARGRYLLDPAAAEPWLAHLHSAAQRIQSAREVLYPVTIYLLDVFLPDVEEPSKSWPASLQRQMPSNVIAPAILLEQLQKDHAELFQQLRNGVEKEEVEVCGGCYQEREDNLLPVESQIWNLVKGQEVSRELLGKPINVFARRKSYGHPQLPLFLSATGLNRALFLPDDDAAQPAHQSIVVSWPSTDGKQVDAYVRAPFKADSAETMFNLGYYIFKTTREDHSATIAFLHRGKAAQPWYEDFLELCRFGPIFGQWTTLSRYFDEVMAGEYTETQAADDFHFDYLSGRVAENEHDEPPTKTPVSGFAQHLQLRRMLDTTWSLAAMQRGLAGKNDALKLNDSLNQLEDKIEIGAPEPPANVAAVREQLAATEQQILKTLADRLLSQATGNDPGYLLINPCSFARRIALELDRPAHPLPIADPIKACQLDEDKIRLVVEAPALGFAWFPKSGPAGTPAPAARMRLADNRHVRNEFFEAEIDTKTGGLLSIADRRNPFSRLAQRLVFNPGSNMVADSVTATVSGSALGEVVSEGTIRGDQDQLLARFRQRFRAWLGRPVLEMRIEITPEQPPAGYPWHAYYGCRFAWPDEKSVLLRGVNGTGYVTNHTRPQTPDFLELQGHRLSTSIFPGGLPFIQRHDLRMLDIIMIPQGETTRAFDIAVGIERHYPMQTALGLSTPVSIIATEKGPPHIGEFGWLYHLDTPNLMLTSMRSGGMEKPVDPDDAGDEKRDLFDAITARLIECGTQSGTAEFRCVRDPSMATQLDLRGERMLELSCSGDTVFLEVTPGDYNQIQIEF